MSESQAVETEATSEEVAPANAEQSEEAAESTEDEFDAARALDKIRKLNSENKNLREAKKAAEEQAAAMPQKDDRITALEAENLRIRIGARNGLPEALIDRLQGTTEEEILADAEKLLGLVSTPKASSPALARVNQADAPLTATTPGVGTLRAAYETQT